MKPTHKLDKILKRVPLYNLKENQEKCPVVLLSTGSFCPIHFHHIKMFEAAKEYLEKEAHCFVLGGLLSPSHDNYVYAKLRSGAISFHHRSKICEGVLKDSEWIDVDDWEGRQQTFVDFPYVAKDLENELRSNKKIPTNCKVYYICGTDHFYRTYLSNGLESVGVLAIGREGVNRNHQTNIKINSAQDHYRNNLALLCPVQLNDLSSTEIRNLMKLGKPIIDFTFPSVQNYLIENGLMTLKE